MLWQHSRAWQSATKLYGKISRAPKKVVRHVSKHGESCAIAILGKLTSLLSSQIGSLRLFLCSTLHLLRQLMNGFWGDYDKPVFKRIVQLNHYEASRRPFSYNSVGSTWSAFGRRC